MERGVFCFSVEVLEDGEADFSLLPSLRYAHSERYLRRLGAAHGFDWIASSVAQVREDQRDPVPGLFVYLSPAAR
jgi:predicted TPR repeat methyltransferase